MRLTVTVKPNSRHESVTKNDDGTLLVRVNAPPVDGRANDRVIDLLAKHFDLPRSSITLIHGARGKRKVFSISE